MLDNQWHFLGHFLPILNHPLLLPWLHTALIAFGICLMSLIGVSLGTRPTPAAQLETTTISNWKSLLHTDARGDPQLSLSG